MWFYEDNQPLVFPQRGRDVVSFLEQTYKGLINCHTTLVEGFTGAGAVLRLRAGLGGGVGLGWWGVGPPCIPLGESGLHPNLLPPFPLLSVPQRWGFKSISQVTHTHSFNNRPCSAESAEPC